MRVSYRVSGALIVLTAGVLFSAVVLKLPGKWWYEDDPGLYYRALQIDNPLRIFTDPQILRSFGIGKAIVPLQILSYWIDVWLFGIDVRAAYIHSLVSCTLAMLAIYVALLDWTKSAVAAGSTAILWMLLPSTLAAHYFISARHYIEGLVFALPACVLAVRYCQASGRRRWLALAAVALLGACAMLSKEVYATTLPMFLFIVGVGRRRPVLSALAVALVVGYGLYRLWVLGPDLRYIEQLLGPGEYAQFLFVLPYTLVAGAGGYLVYGAVAVLAVAQIITRRPGAWQTTLVVLSVLIAALVATYAVAYAIVVTYPSPGTWYRVPFIINTVLIVWWGYLLQQQMPGRRQLAASLLIACLIIPGTQRTQQLWDERMGRAELEGRYYISHPDQLLYSEEDAWWFIMGVHALYDVERPHYIQKDLLAGDHAEQMLRTYPTIWRYAEGGFMPDQQLYEQIQRVNGVEAIGP